MEGTILALVTVTFASLGAIGMFAPGRIARYFSNAAINTDQRNELRAIYGGLPLSIAALGVAALIDISPLNAGQTSFIIAVLLLGMAAGRLAALCVQRPTWRSYLFLLLEATVGGIALYGYVI